MYFRNFHLASLWKNNLFYDKKKENIKFKNVGVEYERKRKRTYCIYERKND